MSFDSFDHFWGGHFGVVAVDCGRVEGTLGLGPVGFEWFWTHLEAFWGRSGRLCRVEGTLALDPVGFGRFWRSPERLAALRAAC